jgi:hypothetical protein
MAYSYPDGIGADGVSDDFGYRSRILFRAKKVKKVTFVQGEELSAESFKDMAKAFGENAMPSFSAESLGDLSQPDLNQAAEKSKEFTNNPYLTTSPKMTSDFITGEQVALYTPAAIQVDDRFEYNTTASLGISGGAALNVLNKTESLSAAAMQALNTTTTGISDFVGSLTGAVTSDIAVVRASQGVMGRNFVSEQLQNAISLAAQVTINPTLRTLFKGVPVRTFNFQFQFIPVSQAEADMIEKIVEFFRYYAYPEIHKDGFYGYKFPERFAIDIQHLHDEGYWYTIKPDLKESYLTNISTTYNPVSSVYFSDGKATQTNMTLSFAEYRALHKGDTDYPKIKAELESGMTEMDNDLISYNERMIS